MTSPRTLARLSAALVAPSAVALFVLGGCEPQDIYLFDGPPTTATQGEPDAGETPYVPAPQADAAPPPEREQPPCESEACEVCVERGLCNITSTLLFCHPVTGDCELLCDAGAPPEAPGNCPATERCDPRLGLCVGCVEGADCADGPLQACDVARGTCVECVGPETCTEQRPVCDVEAFLCIECSSDADCAATGGVCLPGPQRCVQCRNDADCAGRDDDLICLPGELRCVECVSDADCVAEPDKPFCSSERECEDERE